MHFFAVVEIGPKKRGVGGLGGLRFGVNTTQTKETTTSSESISWEKFFGSEQIASGLGPRYERWSGAYVASLSHQISVVCTQNKNKNMGLVLHINLESIIDLPKKAFWIPILLDMDSNLEPTISYAWKPLYTSQCTSKQWCPYISANAKVERSLVRQVRSMKSYHNYSLTIVEGKYSFKIK